MSRSHLDVLDGGYGSSSAVIAVLSSSVFAFSYARVPHTSKMVAVVPSLTPTPLSRKNGRNHLLST